jgi:hypothetical protein
MRVARLLNSWSSRASEIFTICVLLTSGLFASLPLLAQDPSLTTMAGTVTSYSKNTLVVRTESGQYRLFAFDRNTTKPTTLTVGHWVRVISTQTDDPEVRLAVIVTAMEAPAPAPSGTPAAEQPDVVPTSVRKAESAIERESRRFHFGFQGGMALNPELVDIGVLARFGPFFTKNLQFRPNVDFAFGEVTKLFAINGDVIYNMSDFRWARTSVYFGLGPQFNFSEQSLSDHGVSFSDFHYSTALNVILGVRLRNGVFTELKTSVWAAPAPVLRLMVGYTF